MNGRWVSILRTSGPNLGSKYIAGKIYEKIKNQGRKVTESSKKRTNRDRILETRPNPKNPLLMSRYVLWRSNLAPAMYYDCYVLGAYITGQTLFRN